MALHFTDLPLEILLHIVSLTGRDLCGVSRLFMSLYNDSYMHKTLNIFTLDDPIWEILHTRLEQTISKLDIYRKPLRQLLYKDCMNVSNSNEIRIKNRSQSLLDEYIIDSWYIVYGLLGSYPFVRNNNIFDEIQEDEPIMQSTCFCLPQTKILKEPRVPLNIWLSISDTSYLYPIRNIITDVLTAEDMRRNEEYSSLGQICDWIKEPGVYCIRLGTIQTSYMNDTHSSTIPPFFSMKLVASLTGGYNWNKASSIKLLGYNFDSYMTQLKKPWILFKLDLNYEKLFYEDDHIPNVNSLLCTQNYSNKPILINKTPGNENSDNPVVLPDIQPNFKIPVQILTTYKGTSSDNESNILYVSDPRVPSILT